MEIRTESEAFAAIEQAGRLIAATWAWASQQGEPYRNLETFLDSQGSQLLHDAKRLRPSLSRAP